MVNVQPLQMSSLECPKDLYWVLCFLSYIWTGGITLICFLSYIWISQRYLQLNPAKCKHIILSRKHLPIQPTLQLRICGAPIEKVSSFIYLGVWLSEDLKWNAHIQQITKKARRQAGLIYRRFCLILSV